MNQRKVKIDGIEYVRADTVFQLDKPESLDREYTVLAFGQDNAGETVFMRLKGFKTVKFKVGTKISIRITNQPTN